MLIIICTVRSGSSVGTKLIGNTTATILYDTMFCISVYRMRRCEESIDYYI